MEFNFKDPEQQKAFETFFKNVPIEAPEFTGMVKITVSIPVVDTEEVITEQYFDIQPITPQTNQES